MIRNIAIAMILSVLVLLTACGNDVEDKEENLDTDIETNVSEEEVDLFEDIRTSDEEWLLYGLDAYEKKKEPENLKDFFSNYDSIAYLTLYDDMFVFDREKSVSVAEALFRFICDEYGAEALLDIDKRVEYKNAYLKSLGAEIEYIQTPEIEKMLMSMDFSSDDIYKYIISFDNITYYIRDFDSGSSSQYHSFLYNTTTGLHELIEYINENNLSEKFDFDTDREFRYYIEFGKRGYSKTLYSSGDMYINDSYSTLHEAVHAMGVKENDNNIWLSEGICNYLGVMLGFNDLNTAAYIQIMRMAEENIFDEGAEAGDSQSIFYKKICESYIANGGKLDSVDTFDLRLYIDLCAKTEFEMGNYSTIGDTYKAINNKEYDSIGKELSYNQATSMVTYLVDIFGIEKVIEAYATQDIEGIFNKNYDDIKADWMNYLE